NADEIDIIRRDVDGQIALGDLQPKVELLLPPDDSLRDLLDEGCTVVRVDDGIADCEGHVPALPFRGLQLSAPGTGVRSRLPSTAGFPGAGPQAGTGPAHPPPGRMRVCRCCEGDTCARQPGTLSARRRH